MGILAYQSKSTCPFLSYSILFPSIEGGSFAPSCCWELGQLSNVWLLRQRVHHLCIHQKCHQCLRAIVSLYALCTLISDNTFQIVKFVEISLKQPIMDALGAPVPHTFEQLIYAMVLWEYCLTHCVPGLIMRLNLAHFPPALHGM